MFMHICFVCRLSLVNVSADLIIQFSVLIYGHGSLIVEQTTDSGKLVWQSIVNYDKQLTDYTWRSFLLHRTLGEGDQVI